MGALWRDGAVYTLGTLITRGLGFLLLPFYTRALPPEAFGLLDLILAAGVLVNLVVPLETPQAVARMWNERDVGAPRRTLAGTGVLFALFGYSAFVVVAWPAAGVLAGAVGAPDEDGKAAVRAGIAAAATNGLLVVVQAQFRWALDARAYATAAVGFGLLTLGGMALLVAGGTTSVAAVLWVQAGAAAVVAVASAVTLRADIDWRLDRVELRRMLAFSLPLVPAGIAVFATLYVQRFVLNAHASLDEVGHFGIASRIASIATLALIGVQAALTPLVYAHHAEPRTPARLARLFELFCAGAMLLCLVLALFGADVLALLATPAYTAAAPLIAWLAPAALLGQMYVFAPGIPLAKKTGWQLGLTAASAAIGTLLALALVPRWQSLGAAVAACAAAFAFFATWFALGQRLYPLPVRGVRLMFAVIAYLAALAAGTLPGGASVDAAVRVGLVAGLAAVLAAAGLLRWPGLDDRSAGAPPAAAPQ
jgi:O-antigen/teichoic acid export membrane protein